MLRIPDTNAFNNILNFVLSLSMIASICISSPRVGREAASSTVGGFCGDIILTSHLIYKQPSQMRKGSHKSEAKLVQTAHGGGRYGYWVAGWAGQAPSDLPVEPQAGGQSLDEGSAGGPCDRWTLQALPDAKSLVHRLQASGTGSAGYGRRHNKLLVQPSK